MMKLGCLSLSYSNAFDIGTMDVPRFIDNAYELGLDGVEIHGRHFASTDPGYLRDVRMRCLKRGLDFSYIGVSNNFGKPQSELGEQVDLVKRWVDVAAFMGVPMVRVFAAWVAEGEDEERVWERMMPCMVEVARHGEDKGVILGLQNHNSWCVTRTGKDVKRIVEGVDSPYFSHILDTGQYVGSPGADGAKGKEDPSYDFYGSIEETAPIAMHVRAKIYRIQTGVEAWLDYPRIFGILRKVNYNGWVSVVYEGQVAEAEETAIPKAAKYLRSLMLVE
jgi:sugar phosphate isomerase/epimerase